MTIKEMSRMEKCREKLNKLVEKYGLTHKRVLKASKELEKYFDKYRVDDNVLIKKEIY